MANHDYTDNSKCTKQHSKVGKMGSLIVIYNLIIDAQGKCNPQLKQVIGRHFQDKYL